MTPNDFKRVFISPLMPSSSQLDQKEQLKAFNDNIQCVGGIILSALFQIIVCLTTPDYPLHILPILIGYHILAIFSIYYEPTYHKYFSPVLFVYVILFGPLMMNTNPQTVGIAAASLIMFPVWTMYIFKDKRYAIALCIIELAKIHYVYCPHILRIILEVGKERMIEMMKNDSFIFLQSTGAFYLLFGVFHSKSVALEKALKKLSSELECSNELLNQKELFILSLSHEVRNPLNSILGNVELAYDEAKEPSLRQKLFNAKICGELLLSLINNVLDVGKADIGNIEICPTECDLLSLIEKIWITFKEVIKNKGLKPKLEIATMLPKLILVDQHRLTQVLFNLISNAVKFTEQGEIRLKVFWESQDHSDTYLDEDIVYIPGEGNDLLLGQVSSHRNNKYQSQKGPRMFFNSFADTRSSTRPQSVEIPSLTDESESGVLVLQVIDSGPGISEEDQQSLFNKFAQSHANKEKSRLGTGIGLWITKRICDKIDTKIEISSKLGKGTKFSLKMKTVPCKPRFSKMNGLILQKKKNNNNYQGPKAMIVEDSPFNAEILSTYLKSFNIDVIEVAPNGLAAVQFYEKCLRENNPIEIITMDLEMPVMGGTKACQEIRKLEIEYNVKVPVMILVISGNSTEGEISKCIDPHGSIKANHFLRKPAKRSEIEHYLNPFLQGDSGVSPLKKTSEDSILVVDDDTFNLKLIEEALGKAGYNVLLAKNGAEAIEVYQNHHESIKLILMDCEMRIMDGFKACENILKYAAEMKGNIPIVYGLTAHTGKEYEEKCARAGMKQMMRKPVRITELLKVVNGVSPSSLDNV